MQTAIASDRVLPTVLSLLLPLRKYPRPFVPNTPQTVLDGHLQHFDAETAGQSNNLIKAALGLHSQVGIPCLSLGAVRSTKPGWTATRIETLRLAWSIFRSCAFFLSYSE